MKKILFTGDTLDAGKRSELYAKGYEIISAPCDLDSDKVAEILTDCEGYILGGDEIANAQLLNNAGNKLKAISFFGAGYEKYIDVEAASKKGIMVANTPAANADSVAEFTVALMLSSIKDIPHNNSLVKNGEWPKPMTFDLRGKTVGIVGMGNIGSRVARILKNGFGANILYTSRHSKFDIESALGATKVSLSDLLRKSDIITIHASLTEETRSLIGEKEFKLMKDGVVIINTARVEIIDEMALLNNIASGKVKKCAFDGFYEEPVSQETIKKHKLLSTDDSALIVTPHMAYYTRDAIAKMEKMALENIMQMLSGQKCEHLINGD